MNKVTKKACVNNFAYATLCMDRETSAKSQNVLLWWTIVVIALALALFRRGMGVPLGVEI